MTAEDGWRELAEPQRRRGDSPPEVELSAKDHVYNAHNLILRALAGGDISDSLNHARASITRALILLPKDDDEPEAA